MKKQVFIRYNWHGRSDEKWLFWLEKRAKELGCDVSMEEFRYVPFEKTKSDFVESIRMAYGVQEENVYVVPHDPGCLTLLKYLEQLISHNVTDTVLLVAGIEKTIVQKKESTLSVTINRDIIHPALIHNETRRFDARLVVLYSQGLDALPQQSHQMIVKPKRRNLLLG